MWDLLHKIDWPTESLLSTGSIFPTGWGCAGRPAVGAHRSTAARAYVFSSATCPFTRLPNDKGASSA